MENVFKKGDKVFHYLYKWGTVTNDYKINNSGDFYVEVKFDNSSQNYFQNFKDAFLLSFTEYTLEGFSQDRPEPLPKQGDVVWVRDNEEHFWIVMHFIKKSGDKYVVSNNNPFTYGHTEYDEWKYLTTKNPYANE